MAKKKTTFQEWLAAYGRDRVVAELKITERTYFFWKAGKIKPSRENTERILALAPHLTASDILGFDAKPQAQDR